jgi:HK97 family phage major capsid protein
MKTAPAFSAIELKNDDVDPIGLVTKALGDMQTDLGVKISGLETKTTERLDKFEARLNRPNPGNDNIDDPDAALERKAFTGYLRSGRESLPELEVKSLRVSDDTSGGYLANSEFVALVDKNLVDFSPVRQAARVSNTSQGAVILPKRTGTPTARWVGETETRTATESAYGQAEIQIHEMACYVDVSLRLLEDSAVNIEAEVAFDIAEEFGRLEGNSFVLGDGMKKPMGLLNGVGVPYTFTGNASTLGAAPGDLLIDFLSKLKPAYKNRGAWMMNGATIAFLRKLKDGQNNYLWQRSFADGQPDTILGHPVIEATDMPDIGAGTEPIVFGDFGTAYRIFDRTALSVMRDPFTQATSGLVRFHARRRVGADIVRTEAIRKIRCATS